MAERAAVSVESELGNVRMEVALDGKIVARVDFKPSVARRLAGQLVSVARSCDLRMRAIFGDVAERKP